MDPVEGLFGSRGLSGGSLDGRSLGLRLGGFFGRGFLGGGRSFLRFFSLGDAGLAGDAGFHEGLFTGEVLFTAAAFDDLVELLAHVWSWGCLVRMKGRETSINPSRRKRQIRAGRRSLLRLGLSGVRGGDGFAIGLGGLHFGFLADEGIFGGVWRRIHLHGGGIRAGD